MLQLLPNIVCVELQVFIQNFIVKREATTRTIDIENVNLFAVHTNVCYDGCDPAILYMSFAFDTTVATTVACNIRNSYDVLNKIFSLFYLTAQTAWSV